MPVSKYDNPAEYRPLNTFQSEYVAMPFQEMAFALGSKQKKKDEEVLDLNNRANSLNIPTIREHEPSRQEFVNQYNQKFKGLLDSGIDPTSIEFVRKKKEILDELARDSRPGIYKRSVDAYKQQQEYTEGLRKQGKYGYYNDPYARGFQGTDELGNPNEYSFKTYNPSEDRLDPIYKHFDNAKPSGNEKEWFNLDEGGNILSIKEGYEGIGSKFINRNTEKFLDPFLNSNAGRDLVAEIRFNNPEATADDIRDYAKQHINQTAQIYLHGKSTEGNNFKYAPKDMRDDKKQAIIDAQAPVTYQPATPNATPGTEIEMDKDGKAYKYYLNNEELTRAEYEDKVATSSLNSANKGKGIEGLRKVEQTEEQLSNDPRIRDVREGYEKVYGNTKNFKMPSNKELIEDYNEAVKNSKLYVPTARNFSKEKSDYSTAMVTGGPNTIQNLNGSKLQVLGADGGGQINFTELQETVGLKEDGGVGEARSVGRILNNPEFPGGTLVSVSGKNGNFKVAVGGDEVTEKYFSPFVPIFQSSLSGNNVRRKVGDVVYKTYNVPKKRGTYDADKGEGGFITQIEIISPAGNEVLSLDEFEKAINNDFERRHGRLRSAGTGTNKKDADIIQEDGEEEEVD